jgi:hypothetical protein
LIRAKTVAAFQFASAPVRRHWVLSHGCTVLGHQNAVDQLDRLAITQITAAQQPLLARFNLGAHA